MADLIFEIGTEELPSWYPPQALAALSAMLGAALGSAGIAHGEIRTFGTPRRLALLVQGLPEASERRSEKRRGPPAGAAFDSAGAPTRAAEGFASKNGVDPAGLVVEDGYVYAVVETGGESVAELFPGILARLVTDVPAPRKMRWADVGDPFVRPVAWLLARLDDRVLPVRAAGVEAGGHSHGHRFLHPGPVEIPAPADYEPALRAAHVVADMAARRALVLETVTSLAAGEGLAPEPNDELLDEVTGLIEEPFPILGSFGDHYLELPDEVLTTVLIKHQRFFPLRSADGRLAARFVGVSNHRVNDESLVRLGNEQVLDGRLYDARFFWDEDRRKPLAEHAQGLAGVGYQRELGNMADKVVRTGAIAGVLAELLGLDGAAREALAAAAPLHRADLVTGMVYEFPELEGVMARAYALAEGLPAAVAAALEDGLLPKGPDSQLPATTAGALLAAADKLEKLLGFIGIGRRPSGSADPFALRRDGIGLARILAASGWEASPVELAAAAAAVFRDAGVSLSETAVDDAAAFIRERVQALLAEEGAGTNVIRAASAGKTSVIAAARRAHLLGALAQAPAFNELAALYKRVANIAEKAPPGAVVRNDLLADAAEKRLEGALPAAAAGVAELLALATDTMAPWDLGAGPTGGPAADDARLQAALGRLLEIKPALDDFLDNVFVMVEDEAVRNNRLALLAQVRDVLRSLGDLGELQV